MKFRMRLPYLQFTFALAFGALPAAANPYVFWPERIPEAFLLALICLLPAIVLSFLGGVYTAVPEGWPGRSPWRELGIAFLTAVTASALGLGAFIIPLLYSFLRSIRMLAWASQARKADDTRTDRRGIHPDRMLVAGGTLFVLTAGWLAGVVILIQTKYNL